VSSLRVLVVDDQQLVGESIVHAISGSGRFVGLGPATSAPAALQIAVASQPTLAVIDLDLPGDSGSALITDMARASPITKCIARSGRVGDHVLRRAAAVGAAAFVRNDASIDQLLAVLDEVHEHGAWMSPEFAGAIRSIGASPLSGLGALTVREHEVLVLLMRGTSTTAMATTLGISEHTVRNHLRHIFEKLDVSSRAEAIALAIREGVQP
jgi:DNA-binding NarL/FixJ family response regulator